MVVAHGNSITVDHLVHSPENDWALVRLAANVDDVIRPLTIGTVDSAQLPKNPWLSIAGFPADLRERRGDRLDLKDLGVGRSSRRSRLHEHGRCGHRVDHSNRPG
jgi:hypothetical protein